MLLDEESESMGTSQRKLFILSPQYQERFGEEPPYAAYWNRLDELAIAIEKSLQEGTALAPVDPDVLY